MTETSVEKLQRMRAEYKGWRGKAIDDVVAELAATRASLREMVHFARLQGCNRTKEGPCACCDAIKRAEALVSG